MLRVNVTEMEAIFTTVESEAVSLLIRQLLFAQKTQTRTQIGVVPQQPFALPSADSAVQTSSTMVLFSSGFYLAVVSLPDECERAALRGEGGERCDAGADEVGVSALA